MAAVYAAFFTLELYHCVAHVVILCGVRALPRRDLVKVRYYFLFDLLSVFISSFLLLGQYKPLAVVQILQHMYYFITWDSSYLAKRIIDWSSLDWFTSTSSQKGFQIDSTFGTAFDVVVHLVMMWGLAQHLAVWQMAIGAAVCGLLTQAVLYNPRFAWSSPGNMPAWVQKRLGKLPTLDD